MEPEKKRKKINRWTPQQIEILIELWADNIEELRGARRNNHVFQEMHVVLVENGVEATAEDVKTRIHNLTSKYRKERSKIGSSGGSPSEWPLYEKIHAILGQHAINNLDSLVEDSIVAQDMPDNVPAEPEDWVDNNEVVGSPDLEETQTPSQRPSQPELPLAGSSQSGPTSTPRATKKKRDNFQSEILKRWDMMEESAMAQETRQQEINAQFLQHEARRTELLEKFFTGFRGGKGSFHRFFKESPLNVDFG